MDALPGSIEDTRVRRRPPSVSPLPTADSADSPTVFAGAETSRGSSIRDDVKYIAAWVVLPVVAVANGVVRDTTYGRVLSRDVSHSISVVPLCVAIVAWARFASRRWPVSGYRAAARIGLIWLALTLAFEFGLGGAQGVSLREMVSEYNVLRGRLWAIVPLITTAAPSIAVLSRGDA